MGISRRTLVLGSVGGIAAITAGALGLVEAGALPGRARLNSALGWDGGSGTTPDITPGPVITGSFSSAARRTTVGYSILRPAGHTGRLPMAVVLHGRGADHTSAVTAMSYDRYLAAAVQAGTPPFALVTVDGGESVYWHRRANGDDPLKMLTDELLPIAAAHGLQTDRIGLTGWSMGGYGALLMGQQLGARRVSAVAAVSPAIFASFSAATDGSFDNAADFAANDPRTAPAKLNGIKVFIDCGTSDPFFDQATAMRDMLRPTPAGGTSPGAHTDAYMTRVAPQQMDFLGTALYAG